MTRRQKTPASPLGDRLRVFAAAYAASGQRDRAEGLVQAADTVDAELAGSTTGVVDPLVAALLEAVRAITRAAEQVTEAAADLASVAADGGRPVDAPPRRAPRPTSAPPADEAPVRGELRILTAIAQHRDGVTREQLTVLTGYKRSSRDTYLQRLRARGLIDDADRIRATPAGVRELGPSFQTLPTGRALVEHWLARLPEGERRIFEAAIAAGGPVAREDLDASTGYRRSSRDTYIQRLRARGLLVDQGRGMVAIAPALTDDRVHEADRDARRKT